MNCPNYITAFLNQVNTDESAELINVLNYGYERQWGDHWCDEYERLRFAEEYMAEFDIKKINDESGFSNNIHAAANLLIAVLQILKAEGFRDI